MRYSIGEIVQFKISSIGTEKGKIKFIEEDGDEDILYINSFNGWAHKVSETKIIPRHF